MGIRQNRELISSNILNRCIYVDKKKHQLKTGDVCLYFDPDQTQNRRIPKDHKFNDFFKICVFIKNTQEDNSKLIFGKSEQGRLIVRTLYDKNFLKAFHRQAKTEKTCYVELNAISGDYSKMDDDWKKATGYDNAVSAAEAWLKTINK